MRILSTIILILWVLAFFHTLVNLWLVRRLTPGARPASERFVSIIIPARNEERTIEATVRALLASRYGSFEVMVVNDRSTDRTGEIVRSIDDSRLVLVDGDELPPGWLGKPWALHQGTLRARGELLLFVDADIAYHSDALAAAVAYLKLRGRAMITLLPHFDMRGFWENVAMPNLAFAVFVISPAWLANRTNSPLLAIGGGTGNLIRRDVYDAVGGHAALKGAVVDDIALARLVRSSGSRTEGVRAEGFVSVRMYHGLREILEGFTKNGFAAFGRSYVAAALVLPIVAVGNLLPFVLAAAGDPLSIATVVVIILIRVVLFAALGYSLLAAIFLHPLMNLLWEWIMLRSIWITGVRRRLLWRGRVYDARNTRFGAER